MLNLTNLRVEGVTQAEWAARARRVMPGGVSSNVRIAEGPDLLMVASAGGARVTDIDGRAYLDFAAGYGAILFGYASPIVNDAVSDTLAHGAHFAASHRLEILLAEELAKQIPSCEVVRFHNTGSEAVQTAQKLARVATGRRLIVRFAGHYHGWIGAADPVASLDDLSAATDPSTTDIVLLPWNDVGALDQVFVRAGERIAAVFTEPLMGNYGCFEPGADFLARLRDLCSQHGAVLVFDEIISGFRLGIDGAQGYYGIRPDLSLFGKALGGGLPLAAVGGRRDLMARIEAGAVFHSGTFNGNALVTSAGLATLGYLAEHRHQFYEDLFAKGRALMDGLLDRAARLGVPARAEGPGPVFWISFGDEAAPSGRPVERSISAESPLYRRFRLEMLRHGIRLMSRGRWYVMGAHTDDDLALALDAASASLAAADQAGPA